MKIGIDLGTTNSLVSVWKDGKCQLIPNSLGEFLTPSVVSVDEDGSILVGQVAKERLISHPQATACVFKRFIGTGKKYYLGTETFTAEELSSFMLRRLKEDAEAFLGESVEEAVISVPAYFNDDQRYATKAAAQLAGLHTERLVNEPSAAALASRMMDTDKDQSFLVFDFGGGTLDVSVVDCFDNIIEIAAVSGDNHLGGSDFDLAIAQYFCQENGLEFEELTPNRQAILLKQAELCKQGLGNQAQTLLLWAEGENQYQLILTSKLLVKIGAPLFQRIKRVIQRVLTDSGRSISQIDDILLVGGSCKMPVIQEYLAHLLGKRPVSLGSPDTVVAQGVGIYAGIKARDGEIKDMMMTDVCPFTLGIATYNTTSDTSPHMAVMIERNSILPVSVEKNFVTLRDNQSKLMVSIYQGEEYYTSMNLQLGELEIDVPQAPAGEEGATVRFSYDINGILAVDVWNDKNGEKKNLVIVGKNNRMSQQEIEKRLKELEKYHIHPVDQEENRLLLAWGERLYTETNGHLRENIGSALSYLQEELQSQSLYRIHQARKQTTKIFERAEEILEGEDLYGYRTDFSDEETEEE